MDCHTTKDLTRFGLPDKGPPGGGGDCLGKDLGMPGTVCPSNITPDPDTGLGAWTDGEILRAIREGVSRNGRGLFPLMPYGAYKNLSEEDGRAVVAFLRTLAPVKNAVPLPEIAFPVSFFVKMAPKPLPGPVAEPNSQDRAAHGQYLAAVSGCKFCHTPVDSRKVALPGQDFSGGQEFPGPWGVVRLATSPRTPPAWASATRPPSSASSRRSPSRPPTCRRCRSRRTPSCPGSPGRR